jgi:hypothetical protein
MYIYSISQNCVKEEEENFAAENLQILHILQYAVVKFCILL